MLYFQSNTIIQGCVLNFNPLRIFTCTLCLGLFLTFTFFGCANTVQSNGQSKVYAPEDMPDICQDLDFNQVGNDLKEICGVQSRNYKAYRNIPEHRNLLLPKGGKIVKKGKIFELRLQNTLPIRLTDEVEGKILFDEKLRRTLIKSKMDYCEFFPQNSNERLRIIQLEVPLDIGGARTFCYTVESKPESGQRKTGYASRLENLNCDDFQRLKKLSQLESDTSPESQSSVSGLQNPVGGKKP